MTLIKETQYDTDALKQFKEQIGESLYDKLYCKIIDDYKKLIKNFLKREKVLSPVESKSYYLEFEQEIGKALYDKLLPEASKESLIEIFESTVLIEMLNFKIGVVYFEKGGLVTEQGNELGEERLGKNRFVVEEIYGLKEGKRLKMTIGIGGKIQSTIIAPAVTPATSGANCAPLLDSQSTMISI